MFAILLDNGLGETMLEFAGKNDAVWMGQLWLDKAAYALLHFQPEETIREKVGGCTTLVLVEEDLTSELNALGVSWRHVAGCFVDLGGDARLSDVLRALGALGAFQEVEQGRWTVPVVVKSEALLRLYRNSQTEGWGPGLRVPRFR
eukprot:s3663_g1.t1